MAKNSVVSRPAKSTDYLLQLITREAEKGWADACATARNKTVEAWEYLTTQPTTEVPGLCYRMRDELATLSYQGQDYDRYQYKPNYSGRIWYAVIPATDKGSRRTPGRVLGERVTSGHPNESDAIKNFK